MISSQYIPLESLKTTFSMNMVQGHYSILKHCIITKLIDNAPILCYTVMMDYYESTLTKEDLRRCKSQNQCQHPDIGPILLKTSFTRDDDYCDTCYADRKIRRRVQMQRRRKELKRFPNTLTEQEWQRCLTYFKHCCALCGRSDYGGVMPLQKNWYIPISDEQSPGNVAGNVIPVCRSCANSRLDKEVHTWLYERFGLSETGIQEQLESVKAYFSSLGN